MFDALPPPTLAEAFAQSLEPCYPERSESREMPALDRIGASVVGTIQRAWQRRPARARAIVRKAARAAAEMQALDAAGKRRLASELGRELRRAGLREGLVARAFALVRETAAEALGMRHFDTQLMGGWVLLHGMVAEMQTGEGKTLTATLAASTAALAGWPVHVITVNDYLVARDCETMRPLYEALGLTVAAVTEDMEPDARRAAYRCDVVYCTNKTVVFDYLRDRIALGHAAADMQLRIEKLRGRGSRLSNVLLRGLSFAIVDEADSVLIDEARTPLIISREVASGDEERVATQALALARQLEPARDYTIVRGERRVKLTDAGKLRVLDFSRELGDTWSITLRREELARQALSAVHLFTRDEHYLVREGKIQVVDEFTGRVMADRSWSQGLHQLIEVKEGCAVTARKETLARISYQRFFRRYVHLSGMTGTAAEVGGELGAVYALPVVRIPTHKPSRRIDAGDRIHRSEERKWRAIAKRVAALNARGRPVLLGTRSVAASERASRLLDEQGLDHSVLNAKQDETEAEIIARAGERGRITIATNMAGRGTDILLGKGVVDLGGLHVLLSERHEAGRIDRQLAGRCARQGDPGSAEAILSLEDPLLFAYPGGIATRLVDAALRGAALAGPPLTGICGRLLISRAQRRTERAHSIVRRELLKSDLQMGNILSFSGRPE